MRLGLVCLHAGLTGLGGFSATTKHSPDSRQQSVENVSDNNRQQDIARIKKNEHADSNRKNYRAHATTAGSHRLEAGESQRADHEDAQRSHQRHQQQRVNLSALWRVLHQWHRREVNNRRDQTTGNRNRQSHKILLIRLYQSFGENPRSRSLNIKTSEAKTTAHQIHEREKPGQAMQATSLLKCGAVTPDIGQNSGSK